MQGTIGFEAQIDKCLELSEYLYNKIKDREGYEMVFNGKVRRQRLQEGWQKKTQNDTKIHKVEVDEPLWAHQGQWTGADAALCWDECRFYLSLSG